MLQLSICRRTELKRRQRRRLKIRPYQGYKNAVLYEMSLSDCLLCCIAESSNGDLQPCVINSLDGRLQRMPVPEELRGSPRVHAFTRRNRPIQISGRW